MARSLLWALFLSFAARGEPPGYEERLVAWGLSALGREIEPEPEGKPVEEILVASEDVVARDDPFPSWVNLFHVRTRDEVIRREVLLGVGEPYSQAKAAESERILRGLFILAVARVLPVKGRSGGVGVLVVTKDRWSLRLNSEFNFVGNLLQYLRLRPTEQNFLGLNQQVLFDVILRLDTLSVGQGYQNRRLFGSELTLLESAAVVLNRRTFVIEGSTGGLGLGKQLFSLDTPWGFWTYAEWNVRRRRIFRGPSVWRLETPDGGAVPFEYDVRELDASALYTRSFGHAFKVNVSSGVGGHSRRYSAPRDTGLPEEKSRWLEESWLPRSEDAAWVEGQLTAFGADYRVLRDIDTFALSEDYQLGPRLFVVARFAPPLAGGWASFVEAGVAARYRLLWGENLATLSVAGASRHQQSSGWVNQRLAVELVEVTPPLEGGRMVWRTLLDLRRNDLDKGQLLLGGGNGLRGAPPEALSGPNLFLMNLEYRTRPVEIATLSVGFVLFYDAGSAFESSLELLHTFGMGLRVLIPQVNAEVIRFDVGVSFGGPGALTDRFSGSFGQVTDYRPAFLSDPL